MTRKTGVRWWHCLLIAAAFLGVAYVLGPLADQRGYSTTAGFAISLIAIALSPATAVVGIIRLATQIWSA